MKTKAKARVIAFDLDSLSSNGMRGIHDHIVDAISTLRPGQAVVWDTAPKSAARNPASYVAYSNINRAVAATSGKFRGVTRDGKVYIVRVA